MKRDVHQLSGSEFDVLVLGAGITGAWIALDCVQRGLRVAIIDRSDFGAETSAKSSKLLHGGIRYLQQLKFGRVRESARERAHYHQVAPHLSHYIPFLVPTYRSLQKGRLFMTCGMVLYRLVCAGIEGRVRRDKRAPPIRFMNRSELAATLPIQDPAVTGAFVLPESHMHSSERMVISIIKSAVAGGAVAANYVRADQLLMEQDRVCGVHATDTETGESLQIRARMTVNATGPWLSQLLSTLGKGAAATVTTGFSVGSHLVTRQLIRDHAIAIPTEFRGDSKLDRGGRHIFILPWRGHSLIGTSYVAAKSGIDDLRVQPEEIDQLVGSIQQKLPGLELTMQDIVHSFSGIYPLQSMDIEHNTYQGTGEYQIIDHEEQDGVHGMVSSLGAKYTTARRIASKTVDLALKRLDEPARACRSHRIPLLGGDIDNIDTYIDRKQREYADILSGAAVAHLVCYFGSGIDDIAAMVRKRPRTAHELGVELSNTEAEIDWVVKHEMCLHLDDLLYRRTGIGTIGDPGDDIIGRCADIMGEHLGWDEETRQREIDRVRDHYVFSP